VPPKEYLAATFVGDTSPPLKVEIWCRSCKGPVKSYNWREGHERCVGPNNLLSVRITFDERISIDSLVSPWRG